MPSSTSAPPYWPRPPLASRRNAAHRVAAAGGDLLGSAGPWRAAQCRSAAGVAGTGREREEAAAMGSARELIFVSQARKRTLHNHTGDPGRGKKNQGKLMRILSPNGHAFIGTAGLHASEVYADA